MFTWSSCLCKDSARTLGSFSRSHRLMIKYRKYRKDKHNNLWTRIVRSLFWIYYDIFGVDINVYWIYIGYIRFIRTTAPPTHQNPPARYGKVQQSSQLLFSNRSSKPPVLILGDGYMGDRLGLISMDETIIWIYDEKNGDIGNWYLLVLWFYDGI